jgi:hypothetical protein
MILPRMSGGEDGATWYMPACGHSFDLPLLIHPTPLTFSSPLQLQDLTYNISIQPTSQLNHKQRTQQKT